jgi:Short repeat of unknown function (DUF308)
VVAACVAATLALVVGYVRLAGINSGQFADRAAAAVRDDSVKSLIATEITDQIILRNQADLTAVRPLIQSAAEGIVGGGAFNKAFRSGVGDVHAAFFNREQATLTLAVADIGTIVSAALELFDPAVARKVDSSKDVVLLKRDVGEAAATAGRVADRVKALAFLLALLAVVLAAAAIWTARDRRRTVMQLGTGIAAGGVVAVVALDVLRTIAVAHVQGADEQEAAGAVWDVFLGDLHTAAWVFAGSGAVVAAAAASYLKPVDIREPLSRAIGWAATEPERPLLRGIRAVVLLGLGIVVVLNPETVVRLLVTLLGIYLIYAGVSALLRLTYDPEAERLQPAPRTRRRRLLIPAVAAALILLGSGAFVASGGTSVASLGLPGCNGHKELCDRSLPEIALPATHNAMSVPLAGWYAAEQDKPIPNQLIDGIRGLLIDTYYADKLAHGRLRTEVDPDALKVDGVSPEAVAAAKRTRDRLGFSGKGERGMYLCHTFCELGGTPLSEVLRELHAFVVANPSEALVVINQDYVTPADFVKAVRDAGLEPFAYRGPVTGTWPTLREMIESGQRVVFMAENEAGAAPWYRKVYDATVQETPYTFKNVKLLTDKAELAASCRANRGPASAPLFLINHWISTDPIPLPSHAETVNEDGPLLRRVSECERIRHHRANLVAVNFYRRGDPFKVVDTLNGVR